MERERSVLRAWLDGILPAVRNRVERLRQVVVWFYGAWCHIGIAGMGWDGHGHDVTVTKVTSHELFNSNHG